MQMQVYNSREADTEKTFIKTFLLSGPPTFTADENLKRADLPWKCAEGRWAVFSQLSSSG
jgi:hypothetical protein